LTINQFPVRFSTSLRSYLCNKRSYWYIIFFRCPSGGCNFSVKIFAQNDDWAVEKIIEVSSVHSKQAHPILPSMTVQQIKNVVFSNMKEQWRPSFLLRWSVGYRFFLTEDSCAANGWNFVIEEEHFNPIFGFHRDLCFIMQKQNCW